MSRRVIKRERWTRLIEQRPLPGCRVLRNNRYTVFVREAGAGPFGRCLHLSIKRNDQRPVHDWRDLQRLKNEVAGPGWEAVELYPAESRLVDTANQYHLWCFETPLPLGFNEGRLLTEHADVMGAKQRPWPAGEKPADLLDREAVTRKVGDSLKHGRIE